MSFAFIEISIPHHHTFAALLAMLFGSFVNIPLKKIPQQEMVSQKRIRFFGLTYVTPVHKRKETIRSPQPASGSPAGCHRV
jgi:uncharacterized membrane protein